MRLYSRLYIILFAVLIQPLFVCLSLADVSVPKSGGRIVLSTTTDPKSFNDMVAKETSTTLITSFLFEGLTRVNAQTLKVEPNLAERWVVSKDGLIWTFFLRKNLRWSDGVPLTADDVVFTFNDLIYNPEVANSSRDIFTVDGKPFTVEKVDDHTVRFVLPVKFAPFLKGMSQSILPKHVLESAVKEKKFNYTWGIDTPPQEIVGEGPFVLRTYQPGEKVVLKRNPHYWRKAPDGESLPYLDEVLILIVPSSDVELLKFMEGSLDYYDLRGMDYPLLKPLENKKGFKIYNMGPTMGSSFLVFNLNTRANEKTRQPFISPVKMTWFNDIEFRKAVAHAIDREQMTKIVFNGLAFAQFSPISPADTFFFNPKVIRYDYNLKKARDILFNAGYQDRNGDGIIEDIQGNRVQFNIATNADSAERLDIAAIIRQDLEHLGMDVRLVPVEFNTLVGKLTGTFEWDAIVLSLTGTIEPHFGKNVWSSSGQLHMWNPTQKTPATDWEKRIDDLFSKGVQELNENKRKVIYDEFQMIVSEKLPVIYTVLSARIAAIRNKFGNLKPSSYGGLLHNIEEIYLLR
ncbi:MAG: ABC transporter substrate-binding protein [Candidatus Omnitrophica bacterium]|nr:ABC transporter substrate-binding protein [Candidatus Omnitrophota bacterium]